MHELGHVLWAAHRPLRWKHFREEFGEPQPQNYSEIHKQEAWKTAGAYGTRETDHETIASELAVPGAASRLWKEALKRADGRIDVLVNNAGRFEENPVDLPHDEWLENWEKTLRINLTAAAELSRLAVSHWLAEGRPGRCVHIASRAGHRGDSPSHWHYAASKGGMLAMHKTIARKCAGQGILSYAVCPGFTDTAMAGDCLASSGAAAILAEIPLGRVATPDEIATIATFCAIDAPPSLAHGLQPVCQAPPHH